MRGRKDPSGLFVVEILCVCSVFGVGNKEKLYHIIMEQPRWWMYDRFSSNRGGLNRHSKPDWTRTRCSHGLRAATRGGGFMAWVWFPPINTHTCLQILMTTTLLVVHLTVESRVVRTLESTVQTQSQEISELRKAYSDMYSFLTQMRSGGSSAAAMPDMPPPPPPPHLARSQSPPPRPDQGTDYRADAVAGDLRVDEGLLRHVQLPDANAEWRIFRSANARHASPIATTASCSIPESPTAA
ncbi:hypothetical protein PIB30_046410 [Stylosanthes scabra]|uniref:Uncharacterized protein n=1 Tax=Stylosanthes scabra TaxID=79078 RepID=A0ABU6TIE1_9FABA|nr:hypothetical protein [Stylosanthes scabra]